MAEMEAPTTLRRTDEDYYHDPDVREQIEDQLYTAESMFGGPSSPEGWLSQIGGAFPDDRGYFIEPEGGWVIVKRVPNTVIEVPQFSMWFAKPVYYSRTFKRVRAGGRVRTIHWPFLKARIATPDGDLDLLPEEYVPCSDILKFVELIGQGVEMHFIGPEPPEIQQQMFYLRSRGLGLRDATSLLMGDMKSNHVYLTLEV